MVKLISVNEDFVPAMTLLNKEYEPYVAVRETLERLFCSLYEVKLAVGENEARYKFFTKKNEPKPPESLPTTKGVLHLHTEVLNTNSSNGKRY